jgi:protein-S-isoprenylcysteine O-methyltransferase Ste14
MTANPFQIIYALSIFTFIVIRVVFHRKARKARRDIEIKESKLNIAVRAIFGLGYTAALLVYVFAPGLFDWAAFNLSTWVRWVGAGITAGSVMLLGWVQWALDIQFDTTLHIHAKHQLIAHGPYRWVRHPMYSALFLMGLGWLLLTADWFIGMPLMLGIVLLILVRVENEEKVLVEVFGAGYRDYIKHTGRFWPRLFVKNTL